MYLNIKQLTTILVGFVVCGFMYIIIIKHHLNKLIRGHRVSFVAVAF